MKKITKVITNGVIVTVITFCILSTTVFAANTKRLSLLEPAAPTTITQVINIYNDGEGGAQVLSLDPQGWVDFMRTYPNGGVISNIELEKLYSFTEVDPEYPEEVEEFLAIEKGIYPSCSITPGYVCTFFGDGFDLSYYEYRDGIRILLKNDDLNLKVEFELAGAKHAKSVYSSTQYGLIYLVFEDVDGRTLLINEKMEMYELGAISN